MSETSLTCREFEAFLSDYLEGTIDHVTGTRMTQHIESCDSCATQLATVTAIVHEARMLPNLTPENDLWDGIASHIQTPVTSLPSARGTRTVKNLTVAKLGAAAAGLVIATSAVTYWATSSRTPQTLPTTQSVAAPSQPAVGVLNVGQTVPVEQAYGKEITRLTTILHDRRSELDTATISVIEKNLRIIDQAIAQSREVLAKDPKSRFLNDQLNSALENKVELLRTAAFLPART